MNPLMEGTFPEEVVTKGLEYWAKTAGEKTFLYYGEDEKRISYQQFHQLTNSIGHSLMDQGIQKGDRISVFLNNPYITIMVMFGIWKCGAVFSPINFNYRGKLLSYQLNDTKPKLLITERSKVPVLNEISLEAGGICTVIHNPKEGDHDYSAELAALPLHPNYQEIPLDLFLQGENSNLDVEINYWDTANIIYTSGTTGPAKGVVQSHRWINGYTAGSRQMMSSEDVIYNDLPLYHVGGAFFNVAKAVYEGCTVGLWDKFSPQQFWNRIHKCKATMVTLLDVMIPWLVNPEPSENDRSNTLNKVHMQPLPLNHHEVAQSFGFDIVTAGFGQTETGNPLISIILETEEGEGTPPSLYKGLSRQEIMDQCELNNIPIMVGKQVKKKGYMGTTPYYFDAAILDDNDVEVPSGEVGQLALRPHLPHLILSEYFNKPESTVKSFRNLWFHTGDAAYLGEDGKYYFVDRLGGVIRCRGEKISSYQLEDIINGHPEINLTAAFPIPAEVGDEDDVAVYVVRNTGSSLTEAQLHEWVKDKMPKYMWPKHVRFTDEIPRTPTNKVEKYKLQQQLMAELRLRVPQ
ncbi:acyl-CoA synthetase /AMP-acid ligase II [Neobacillus bataviensis LMG 21833]|uniref:Acyl-CoA synthetase /AMP-acid ligase II n=1 Tax=Neobacillus bataviensis LMG 21833 TaxID=1117379 RepID=K6DRU6_9BACI|nr:AMP-binding protein [Neobacillus bataviensis]EKN70963.1 acyl-CoA synthetase /AMP-acid ligase II [Neobacillus bataviensis LMG 21833]